MGSLAITSPKSEPPGRSFGRRGKAAGIVAAVVSLAVLAGACGASPATPRVAGLGRAASTTSAPPAVANTSPASEYATGLKYARCMRAHGEPNFPDPNDPGGFPTGAIESLGPTSPQFARASSACSRLLPNGGQQTPAELQQAIQKGLQLARCMRAHGEPNFPDPGLSGGTITIDFNGIDPSSPQYLKAAQTCERLKSS